jgi:hypothetical protein
MEEDMPNITLRAVALALIFASAPARAAKTVRPVGPDQEELTEARRKEAIQAYNTNGDDRLKGKEIRTFKRERPRMFDNLMEFCDKAVEHPVKNGVVVPTDKHEAKRMKCKKSNVGRTYYNAWSRGGDTPAEEKAENAEKGLTPNP